MLRLHDVSFERLSLAHDVGDSIVLSFGHELWLLCQEALLRECSINLLSQSSCGRLMLRRLLVELDHLVVEFICFGRVDLDSVDFSLAHGACRSAWFHNALGTRGLQLLDLSLNIRAFLLELFISEEFVAHLDAKLSVEPHVQIGLFRGIFATCGLSHG